VKYLILSGNLLLRESQFHIVNCLMSFNFKLFFVYTRFLQTLRPVRYIRPMKLFRPASEVVLSIMKHFFEKFVDLVECEIGVVHK